MWTCSGSVGPGPWILALFAVSLASTPACDPVSAGACLRFSVTFIAKDRADEDRVLREIAARLAGVIFEF